MVAGLFIVARRLLASLLMLWLTSVIVFVGTAVLPGDALEVSIPPDQLPTIPKAELDAQRRQLGLDRPPVERYLNWLSGVIRLDFGRTILNKEPVMASLYHPVLNSLLMAAAGMLLVPGLAFLFGVLAALHPGGRVDTTVSFVALLGYSIPEFVLGNLFILLFSVTLSWATAVITLPTNASARELVGVLPMPVLALFFGVVAYQLRLVRAAMIEVLASDFVERARLAGLPAWRVIWRHALPVAMVPTLAATAQFFAGLLSGLLVIEVVFNYPGLGVRVVEAIGSRDVATIQAIGFMAAVAVITANLMADLAIVALDPRIREPNHG
jgi:peptide/nickel transport system permease protein